jgi:hypothetical protein
LMIFVGNFVVEHSTINKLFQGIILIEPSLVTRDNRLLFVSLNALMMRFTSCPLITGRSGL